MGVQPTNDTEQFVLSRLRAAVDVRARVYGNVRYTAKSRPGGPAHDGEADAVVVDPEQGILVVEVKGGEPGRDRYGRWHIGGHELARSPFEQAEAAKRDVVNALRALPAWPRDLEPRAGHAVAFPEADLASLPAGHALLGPDAPRDIVLDAAAFDHADPRTLAAALDRAFAYWIGDGSRGRPLDEKSVALADEYLAPSVELHRLLRHDIDESKPRLLQASNAQLQVLNYARNLRRVEVVGPAGSGKSLVAVEKARRLAKLGYRTLYVCFNQALATALQREIAAEDGLGGRLTVSTFHRLAERLGRRAGVLRSKPSNPGTEWFSQVLPAALDAAIDALPDELFHAIVVDEGQDFEPRWLTSLQFLLYEPTDGVLWVFHDPGQALFRDDRVGELGLEWLELMEDWRSPAPVAELAARFYRGPGEPVAMQPEGRPPRIVEAAPGRETLEAVRKELHRLLEVEGVRPWQVAVLSGTTAEKSAVWRQRRFGNAVLWNGAVDDEGRSKGLPAEHVPDEPPDVVLFETVRRFKGLEREVIVLCELPSEAERLDALLYTALTRATAYVVAIVLPELARRLRSVGRTSGTAGEEPAPMPEARPGT